MDHLEPKNKNHDITIYAYNYPKILDYLNNSVSKHGTLAGFWFKEGIFRDICKRVNIRNSKLIVESRKINIDIFKRLKNKKKIFSYQDIKVFGRTHSQSQKAIRCWKKNRLIKRIGWNKYKILEECIKEVT